MNMRTVHDRGAGNVCDPYDDRGHTGLVDKMIGSAYDVVKFVARNLSVIRYVASNMETIYEVGQNLKTGGLVLGMTGLANETVSLALPEGVTPAMILTSSVIVETAAGDLYGTDSGYVTASIQAGALRVYLASNAPVAIQNAVFRWYITYGVS